MYVVEEYASPAEKRKAQRDSAPLKRKHPTGKSRGFMLVFNEDGNAGGREYSYGAFGNVCNTEPGDGPHSLASAFPSVEFLRESCRVVAFDYLPTEWKKAFARMVNDFLQREDDGSPYWARYRRLVKKAGLNPLSRKVVAA